MTDLEELSFRHLIDQLREENQQLREEVKRLRLSIKNYLNGKAHESHKNIKIQHQRDFQLP